MNDENFQVFNYPKPNKKEEAEIFVKMNQKFDIVIDGNLTTGFNWFLQIGDQNDLLVKPLNLSENKTGEYLKGNHPPGWCGGSGTLHFKFEAVTVGTQELKFVYKTGWNNDIAAELNIKLVVSDS